MAARQGRQGSTQAAAETHVDGTSTTKAVQKTGEDNDAEEASWSGAPGSRAGAVGPGDVTVASRQVEDAAGRRGGRARGGPSIEDGSKGRRSGSKGTRRQGTKEAGDQQQGRAAKRAERRPGRAWSNGGQTIHEPAAWAGNWLEEVSYADEGGVRTALDCAM